MKKLLNPKFFKYICIKSNTLPSPCPSPKMGEGTCYSASDRTFGTTRLPVGLQLCDDETFKIVPETLVLSWRGNIDSHARQTPVTG